jgi:glycosyltransferase involved in cell wall biosynthesis
MALALGHRVHFVLAGGGAELERMRRLVVEHRLEGRAHLPGLVLQPALPMSVIDLYVTLNVGPNTGLSAMEAAWSGLPVVAIQLLPYYKAGPTDWIWSDSDLAAVAVEGIRLLGSPMEREALGARQKAYVASHHTVDAMAHAYDSLYRSALNENRSGSAGRDTKP